MKLKPRINIIGRGNVACHLKKAYRANAEIFEVNPHTLAELNPDADITLISVIDSALPEVLARLPKLKGVVAHTSGSTSIDVFNGFAQDRFGVFYPLQTFSKSKELDYGIIPFYIEGSDEATGEILFNCARMISSNVRYAGSEQRKRLHIGAVFACNFVNHLWTLSDSFLKEAGLEFKDLIPLISETVDKIKVLSPAEAQTGPAIRGDQKMIDNHLKELEKNDRLSAIYRLLSESILATRNPLQE
ncbi:MAG: DUF2520 domain-containing protein [Muribaculaceae bacterium]|nr:DUF2520 domain-containing protein [Muribaculaceae bacterium]